MTEIDLDEDAGLSSNGEAGVSARRVFDFARAESAVRELLIACGEDPEREGLRDTPGRVARAYRELFAGLYTEPDSVLAKTFDESHEELVLVTVRGFHEFRRAHVPRRGETLFRGPWLEEGYESADDLSVRAGHNVRGETFSVDWPAWPRRTT